MQAKKIPLYIFYVTHRLTVKYWRFVKYELSCLDVLITVDFSLINPFAPDEFTVCAWVLMRAKPQR